MYHADRVVREEGEMEKSYHIEYGFMRVRLPGRRELLTLVTVRGYGAESILLLTNVAVARSRNSCSFVVRAYIKRWQGRGEDPVHEAELRYRERAVADVRTVTEHDGAGAVRDVLRGGASRGQSEAGGFGVPCTAVIEAALRNPQLPVLRHG